MSSIVNNVILAEAGTQHKKNPIKSGLSDYKKKPINNLRTSNTIYGK